MTTSSWSTRAGRSQRDGGARSPRGTVPKRLHPGHPTPAPVRLSADDTPVHEAPVHDTARHTTRRQSTVSDNTVTGPGADAAVDASAQVGTQSPGSSARDRDDAYDHLTPLLARYARLEADHRDRAELCEQLARGFHPVVAHIAARYRGRGEPVEDLEQIGALGLVNALSRFDPDHGAPFLAFAVPTITGEIRRHFRDRTWSLHVPRRTKDLHTRLAGAQQTLSTRLHRAPRVSELAAHLDVSRDELIDALAAQQSYKADSLDVPLGGSDTTLGDLIGGPDTRIGVIEARESVRPAIENLPERERTILTLRFFKNMTQTQIAEQVGLSQMHVSRLLTRTLAGLRQHLTADPDTHRPHTARNARPEPGLTGRGPARSSPSSGPTPTPPPR